MPSIGKDLAKIRTHLGYTVQDIQQATKIPVSTVQTIEDGSIFTKFDEGKTYIRSFVRSYGKAVRINDDLMIKALDQQESGNYNHLLFQDFPELRNESTTVTEAETEVKSEKPKKPDSSETHTSRQETELEFDSGLTDTEKKKNADKSHQKKSDEPSAPETDPSPETETKNEAGSSEPSVKNVDWAKVGNRMADERKHTSAWVVGIIILIILASIAGYFFYQNGYLSELVETSTETTTTETQSVQNGLSFEFDEPEHEMTEVAVREASAELDDVLYITIFAAYDNLDPVRVWSDMKPRLDPYWINQGDAMNFEFRDTIRIRAQYSNALIFKNGHMIENAYEENFNESENYLELTRGHFTSDSKWATSVSLQIPSEINPPENILDRPTF